MVLANQGNPPPSLFEPHNLNHVSVFFPLTLRLSCLPLCWPVHAYCSPHPLPYLVCWLINIRDEVFFIFFFLFTNHFIPVFSKCFYQSFFHSPPLPLFSFLLLLLPFQLPDFLQPACFSACLLLLCVSFCLCGTACVSLFV